VQCREQLGLFHRIIDTVGAGVNDGHTGFHTEVEIEPACARISILPLYHATAFAERLTPVQPRD
jgi:hypothetical protein